MSDAIPVPADQRPQVQALLDTIFKLMDYPARLDFRDMPDGALGVAVHFDGDQPGISAGKRSLLVDSIQFLVNKAINRPNVPRRWVNLAVNAFPEPRQLKDGPRPSTPPPASAPAPVAASPAKKSTPERGTPAQQKPAPHRQPNAAEERAVEVPADPAWTQAAHLLAQKAARLGRVYAVMMASQDDRARLVAAGKTVAGQTVRVEGEGHWRRVAFVSDKLVPITRKTVMPDYDDEDEDE